MKLPGVLHDAVVHKKRRVKVNGKWVEKNPHSCVFPSTSCAMAER